ncbi:hypothetical protein FHT00_000275 [Sphingomonas insulae]|uniref:Hemerythrin-like domain-containing protein n=1 Tax=Sphingomonas insulae TaxID=424800 RepID=A0ABP3SXI7_9SPHN|nr:hemerythrin domain-containing protein [Sphingomonas insulae]NIJ28347.1 hypothetical protein [Sphingomonas insulae]
MVEYRGNDLVDPRRTSWARLVGDHDRIAQQCAALVVLARRPDRPAEAAAVLLLELAVCVADHLGIEDQVIDLTVTAVRTGVSPDDAATMSEALDVLKADWTDFIVRWTPAAVLGHWSRFAGEAETMMSRLSDQVRHENELLYAEALRRGIIDRGQPVLH